MNLETQFKIKNNQNNLKYLKENSNWYKHLNRSPLYIKNFEEEMKTKYKLTPEDKLNKFINSVDQVSRIIDILK